MKNILLIVVAVIIIGAGGWVLWKSKKSTNNPSQNSSTVSGFKFQEPRTDSQNGVEIAVKVKPCDDFCENSTFEVGFTTHEGDLNFDLVKASTLEVDGKVYEAKSWDGGSGGHHLSGTLAFPGIDKEPTKMILRMKNIVDADRTFTWE